MKVGVIGGFRSVTHSVSWVVWALCVSPADIVHDIRPPPSPSPPGSSPGQALGGGRGCWKALGPTEHPEEPFSL